MHDGSHLLVHSQSNSQSDTAVVTVTLGHSYGQLQLRGSQSQLQSQSQLVTVTVSHYTYKASGSNVCRSPTARRSVDLPYNPVITFPLNRAAR